MDEKEVYAEQIASGQPTDVRERVVKILEDLALVPVRDLSRELVKDLALDSLRLVMLLVNLEETFEIELDESDMNPFQLVTVQDVVNLVSKYTQGGTNNG